MKKLLLAFVLLIFGAAPALADNCSAYPYILLNGVTADANQVMADFNSVLSCGNNQLMARNNNLSDLQSASTARTNLGLGSAATLTALGAGADAASISTLFFNGNFPQYSSDGTLVDSGQSPSTVLKAASNLLDLTNATTARTNLGLGSIATANVTYSTSAPSGSANAGDLWVTYVP